jgi:glyoxylase-like metal-dependent hydrolase (beta-lactamase superfamily II)
MGFSSGANDMIASPGDPQIVVIQLGITCVYLLPGMAGYLLIDAGPRGYASVFLRTIRRYGISPKQIRLILVTHVHYDHVGSLQAIQDHCRCPVLVHRAEAERLARGLVVLPPGTQPLARLLIALARRHSRLVKRLLRFDPVMPDRIVETPLDLRPFGFDARILPTPGHTPGSVSVITASGQALVGDLAINYLPGERGPFYPPFGDSRQDIRDSWRTLLDRGARIIYPSHGKPFKAERLPLSRS